MRSPSIGAFIVIEGLDGSGTTTQVQRLAAGLQAAGRQVLTTREPTDGPFATGIRLFLTKRIAASPTAVALAFAADRLDHVSTRIAPAVAAGTVVISDRYVLSSLAYQSLDHEPQWVWEINKHARTPDLTVYLDVPAKACMDRITARGGGLEYFERLDRLERIEVHYRRAIDAARLAGERVVLIDGRKPIDAVAAEIAVTVSRFVLATDAGVS